MYNLLDADAQLASSIWQPLDVEAISLAPPQTESAEESWFTETVPHAYGVDPLHGHSDPGRCPGYFRHR